MTGVSLIFAAAVAVTAMADDRPGTSASQQPLEVLMQHGAELKDDVLTISTRLKEPAYDLQRFRDVPSHIDVVLTAYSLGDDDLEFLRGAVLKKLYLSADGRITEAGLIHLRQCERVEEIELRVSGQPSPRAASTFREMLARLKGIPGLRKLTLHCPTLTVRDLAHVAELTDLEELDLGRGPIVTDEGLAQLAPLVRLKRLSLMEYKHVTATGVAHLAELPSLESVRLSVDEEALAGLKHVTGLRVLEIGSGIADVSIEHFVDMVTLDSLNLSVTRITDDGLSRLARLPRLKTLRIRVPGPGVEQLARLPHIESLDLSRNQVGDDGLRYLGELSTLKSLSLANVDLTGAGTPAAATVADGRFGG